MFSSVSKQDLVYSSMELFNKVDIPGVIHPASISSTHCLVDESSDGEPAVPEFDFVSHPHGGWVFDSPEAQTKWKSFVKKNKWFKKCSSSNPYHP